MRNKILQSEFLIRSREHLHGYLYRVVCGKPKSVEAAIEFTGHAPEDLSFLVGSSQGILVLSNRRLYKILEGPVYGITQFGKYYYAVQRLGGSSRILKFIFEMSSQFAPRIHSIETFIQGLSNGVHQIDFVGEVLFITDTYHNSLSLYRLDGTFVNRVYPAGRLPRGDIFSPNYRHYNSIYWDGDSVLLVAHNNSLKTGRASLIQYIDENYPSQILKEQHQIGLCAHNVLKKGDSTYWCDSLRGALVQDSIHVAHIEGRLTRGLAVNDSYAVVGGSALAFGNKRFKSDARVVVFNIKDYSNVGEINIRGIGAISEIRLIGHDYGLSNSNLPSEVARLSGAEVKTNE